MHRFLIVFTTLICLGNTVALAQSMATLQGTVRNGNGLPLDPVNITITEGSTTFRTTTNPRGRYSIEVPAGVMLTVLFDYLTDMEKVQVRLQPGEKRALDVTIKGKFTELEGTVVRGQRTANDIGAIRIDPNEAGRIVSLTGDGISTMIQLQTGQRSELSSQYSVRGGNYDENLVYVNDFEINRPFLTRSGQQEGLSFVNADLAQSVYFSLGGFQAKYGDKMSSVLDVTYKKPSKFGGSASVSLLGGSAHLEGSTKNQKLTYLVGLRQKTNQYLLQSQPTKGVYNPSFTDVQALVNYSINKHWEVEALGNYARNRFSFSPEEQTSSFGVLSQAFQLRVFYNGGELDQFDTRFGGLSTTYSSYDTARGRRLKLKVLGSAYQSDEQETYDISGEYLLGELETDLGKANFGQIKTALGTGIIQSHARNYLKVDVSTVAHRGSYDTKRNAINWGLDATNISIDDRLSEWERRDSAGYNQPYSGGVALPFAKLYRTNTNFSYQRYSGFLQDNFGFGDSSRLNISAGIRFNYSELNKELIISPRLQLLYKPFKRGTVENIFKAAVGLYAQPPIYREMRDLEGNVNTQVKAQKSLHFLAGTEHNFMVSDRNVKITTEVYYKKLTDLVPFEYDNVRIRYFGENNAKGFAYGGEVRVYGELVKGANSFLTLGILKTSEDILDDKITYRDAAGNDSAFSYPGFIPRPGDQRAMLGMYFQDYLPGNKNFKVHLNLLYATGLPFGPPDGERYQDILRLPDYKRVDVGFSALLLDGVGKKRPAYSLFRKLESIWASLEVFNLLGLQNTISYTWVQDQTSGRTFAVPNRLTSRLLNVKVLVKF